jgi:hypothetical protein
VWLLVEVPNPLGNLTFAFQTDGYVAIPFALFHNKSHWLSAYLEFEFNFWSPAHKTSSLRPPVYISEIWARNISGLEALQFLTTRRLKLRTGPFNKHSLAARIDIPADWIDFAQ